jgi:hypothetical protein
MSQNPSITSSVCGELVFVATRVPADTNHLPRLLNLLISLLQWQSSALSVVVVLSFLFVRNVINGKGLY